VIAGAYFDSAFGSYQQTNLYTAKYAATTGELLWEKSYDRGVQGNDSGIAVATDANGNVAVTGPSAVGFNVDIYTVKYASANGAILWDCRYNGSANSNDVPVALKMDSTGNVIVTGYSTGTNSGSDFYTVKYAATNGAVLWDRRYNGPANGNDWAQALGLDSTGNALITGFSLGTNSSLDFYTAKYAATDGTVLWERRHNGPANRRDQPTALAVDGEGNVVVVGSTENSMLNSDFFTAKYAAEDGALIWERFYNGLAAYNDVARAVAVDSKGNVVVTGFTFFDNRVFADFYTAKYAAEDGQLLWEVRYNGPANKTDGAIAVALDANDNVMVAGNSMGIASGFDYYTAAYVSDSGGLLWEKRYNGPINRDDSVVGNCGLAIGPGGQIAVTGSSGDSISFPYYGWATVVYREVLPSISVEMIPSGVRLTFTGTADGTYQIERASSLSGPWEVIAGPVASANGLVEYIDADRLPGTAFYRTRTP